MVNPYFVFVRQLVPKILSMLNRNPYSSSYGCFDRNFWHFKTIIDFPSATYQQVVLGLSLLASTDITRNIWYGNTEVQNAVKAGVMYWCRIQNRDGSFNEYYENDRSFCPTAFTAFAAAFAYYRCKFLFSDLDKKTIEAKLLQSAEWLSNHSYPIVQNQMIASMNALYWIGKITGLEWVEQAFQKRRSDVLTSQNEEGWFPEYGGADIGYSFKALDLLSYYLKDTADPEMEDSVERLIHFVRYFVHPDGTAGGEYGSRCTQHVFPFGLEFFSNRNNKETEWILNWYRTHLAEQNVINPLLIDDKYILYFYFNSFVQAFLEVDETRTSKEPGRLDWPETRIFRSAGIFRQTKNGLSAWIGYKRNGVCRIFLNNRLLHSDCGYVIRLKDGTLCATQGEDQSADIHFDEENETSTVTVSGNASRIDDSMPLTKWIIPFKLFCKTVLKSQRLGYLFHSRLLANKIAKQKKLPIKVTRTFYLNKERLMISDRIDTQGELSAISDISLVRDVTTVHSPSSRFYQNQYFGASTGKSITEITDKFCTFTYSYPMNGDQQSN